jgi:hypothetical protein
VSMRMTTIPGVIAGISIITSRTHRRDETPVR